MVWEPYYTKMAVNERQQGWIEIFDCVGTCQEEQANPPPNVTYLDNESSILCVLQA